MYSYLLIVFASWILMFYLVVLVLYMDTKHKYKDDDESEQV